MSGGALGAGVPASRSHDAEPARLPPLGTRHARLDRRTTIGDILGTGLSTLNDEALYRTLDRPHPNREQIERELAGGSSPCSSSTTSVPLRPYLALLRGRGRSQPAGAAGGTRATTGPTASKCW